MSSAVHATSISGLPAQRPASLRLPMLIAWLMMILTFTLSDDVPGGATLDPVLSYVKFSFRALAIGVLGICAGLSFWRDRRLTPIAVFVPFLLFVGWAITSTLWSPLKSVSFGQAGSLLALALLAVVFAQRCRDRRTAESLLQGLSGALLAIGTCLLLLRFAAPTLGVMQRSGTGLFHATNTAATASLGILLPLMALVLRNSSWAKPLLIAAVPVHFAGLLLSANRLAFGLTVVLGGMLVVVYFNRVSRLALVLCICTCGGLYLAIDPGLELVSESVEEVTQFLRRGQSAEELAAFSGRDEMWEVMWESYGEAPWIGHGYFVTSGTGSVEVWHEEGNFTAHNLLLQVLVTTGIVGLALFLWGVLQPVAYVVWTAAMRRTAAASGVLLIIIGGWYFLWGLLNESFMGPVQPESVVFFAILGMSVGLATSRSQIQRAAHGTVPSGTGANR